MGGGEQWRADVACEREASATLALGVRTPALVWEPEVQNGVQLQTADRGRRARLKCWEPGPPLGTDLGDESELRLGVICVGLRLCLARWAIEELDPADDAVALALGVFGTAPLTVDETSGDADL